MLEDSCVYSRIPAAAVTIAVTGYPELCIILQLMLRYELES